MMRDNGIPGSGAGGTFPFDFVEQPDGTFLVQRAELSKQFNDLELYLMGLLPAEEVSGGRVFLNRDQFDQLRVGGVLEGPVETVTIEDIVAFQGPRVPAAGEARTGFHMASIVLSSDRLLSDDEMAFFDHMAARGEALTELPFTSGRASGITKPFFVATRGQGTLSTTIPEPSSLILAVIALLGLVAYIWRSRREIGTG